MIDLKFNPTSEVNRFGYYTVGSYHTYSKIDALEVGVAVNKVPQWHFCDEEFDRFDWTQEPRQELWDLYIRRARQIREKYDYLVLLYSGGADSHNLLNVFVRSGIHLDEIMQFTNYEISGRKDNFWNSELYNVAMPITQHTIDTFKLRTKHRIVDVSDDLANMDKRLPDLSYWLYARGQHLNINGRSWCRIRDYHHEYQALLDQGKNVCFVYGWDKPPVYTALSPSHPGRTYHSIMFRDTMETVYSPLDQIKNHKHIHNEAFYWSPDSCDILSKQGHIIQKFMDAADVEHPWLSAKMDVHCPFTLRDGKIYYLTPDALHHLIYPHWDPATFSTGKPTSMVIGERDKWMLRHESPLRTLMLQTVRELQRRVKPYWVNWKKGIANLYSPPYYLGTPPPDAYIVDIFQINHTTQKYQPKPVPREMMRQRHNQAWMQHLQSHQSLSAVGMNQDTARIKTGITA